MHYITKVKHESGYCLILEFENGDVRQVDLENRLDGEMFEPLRDIRRFSSARLNPDIDTVVWDNGADMSPDFLYEISIPVERESPRLVAESASAYGKRQTG